MRKKKMRSGTTMIRMKNTEENPDLPILSGIN
jgi:hypothetical protein